MNTYTRLSVLSLFALGLAIPASSQILRQMVTTVDTPTSCTVPGTVTNFAFDTPQVYTWFLIDGVVGGDVFKLDWTAGDGVLFTTSTWDPSPSGSRCYWARITPGTAHLPVSKSGVWTIALFRNGIKMQSQTFLLGADLGRPIVSSVQNAASDEKIIAPNTWISIKGLNLSRTTRVWNDADFATNQMPTVVDSVSVVLNGKSGYVSYVSPTQINVLTPPDLPLGPVQLQVRSNGDTSNSFTIESQKDSLSFFTFNGLAIAGVNADGTLLPGVAGTTWKRPKAGDIIVVFGNGFGATNQLVVSGSPTQSGTLLEAPTFTIAGAPAQVLFGGLVSPGLYQFNVVVPARAAYSFRNNSYPYHFHAITATRDGHSTQDDVQLSVQGTVQEQSLSNLILTSSTVVGGEATTAQVTLSQPDPTGHAVEIFVRAPKTLTVTPTNGSIAISTPFGSDTAYLMVIPAGQTTLNLSIATGTVQAAQNATITASLGSQERTVTLSIQPVPVQTWTFRDFDLRMLGTLRIGNTDVNTQITANRTFLPTGKVDGAMNSSGRIIQLSLLFADLPPSYTPGSVTYTASVSGLYLDSNDVSRSGTIISAKLTLSGSSSAVGGMVTGSLQFSTLNGSFTLPFTGTITASFQ